VLSKEKIAVIPIQEQIVDKLKNFSDIEIQEILKFADFLLGQQSQQKASSLPDEISNTEAAETYEENLVHYVGGVVVVKAAYSMTESQINWDTVVRKMRKERIRNFLY
jgi:hypothetical protein